MVLFGNDRDPNQRASAKELLEHPYMSNVGRSALVRSAHNSPVPSEVKFEESVRPTSSLDKIDTKPNSFNSEFNSMLSFIRSSSIISLS